MHHCFADARETGMGKSSANSLVGHEAVWSLGFMIYLVTYSSAGNLRKHAK